VSSTKTQLGENKYVSVADGLHGRGILEQTKLRRLQNPVGFAHHALNIFSGLAGRSFPFTIDLIYVRLATRHTGASHRQGPDSTEGVMLSQGRAVLAPRCIPRSDPARYQTCGQSSEDFPAIFGRLADRARRVCRPGITSTPSGKSVLLSLV